jgi:hypothetical protein
VLWFDFFFPSVILDERRRVLSFFNSACCVDVYVAHWMDDGELRSAAASARKECWILVACNAPCGIVFISRETVSLFFYSSF